MKEQQTLQPRFRHGLFLPKTLMVLLSLMTSGASLFSQPYNIKIENITFPDGTQMANIRSIHQDSTGLIWMVNNHRDNVLTFDGKTIRKVKTPLPNNQPFTSLPNDPMFYVTDSTLKFFNPYTWESGTAIDVPKNTKIVRVLGNGKGIVWGQSYGPDLVILCSKNGQPFMPIDTILPKWYYDVVGVWGDFYYVKVEDRVYEFDSEGCTNVFFMPPGKDPAMPSMEIDAAGTIWVNFDPEKTKGYFYIYYKRRDMAQFELWPGSEQLTAGGKFGKFKSDGKNMWYLGGSSPARRWNLRTGVFEDIGQPLRDFQAGLPFLRNGVANIFQDNSGQYWLMCGGGIVRMTVEEAFDSYSITSDMGDNCGSVACFIAGIAEGENGDIYFSSVSGSLWRLDPRSKMMAKVSPDVGSASKKQHSMAFDQGKMIVNDRELDLATGIHHRIHNQPVFSNLWVVAADRQTHRRWLAVHGVQNRLFQWDVPNPDRLFAFDPAAQAWRVINLTDSIASGQNVEFRELLYSPRRNSLFLARMSNGLVEMTPDGQVLRVDERPVHTTDLHEDEDGNLWASSDSEQGLIKLFDNLDSIDRTPYQPLPALGPLDRVYHILPEGRDYLWLVSTMGVFRLQHKTGKLLRFPMFPSFAKTATQRIPAFAASDGTIYLGTLTGEVLAFQPEKLMEASRLKDVYPVVLTQYSRYNEGQDSLFVQQNSLGNLQEIRLTHRDRFFALEFFVPDFRSPAQNKYSWWLEDYDMDWSMPTEANRLQYENLPPGEYTLHIRGGLMEEYFASSERTLRVVVLQAWYKSWWAVLGYVLLLGTAVFGFYKFQLNRRLEHAEAERLKEMDALKTRLYTNITHEFRTPLTVILGNLEMMKLEIEKLLSDLPISQFLISKISIIRRNSKNLLRLINQMLDLSKLDAGTMKMDLVRGDIINYLQYLAESFHSMAYEKKIQLTFYPEIPELAMDFDEAKIQHVVYNLLSNALKFTGEGGKVILHAGRTERNGQPFLQLKVQDTGAGIPAEQLERIFDRFYQVDSTHTRKGEGTGIGLALTKELVELMGGHISVQSELGRGSVFTLLLPVLQNPGTPQAKVDFQTARTAAPELPAVHFEGNENAAADGEKPLLLIIEDNADVVTYVVGILEKDYDIRTAPNGQAGIEKALELVPDIIISDVMMPEKDGYEVCETLKNDERTSHIPIILLTAKAAEADRITGLRKGADAYLMKPFNKEELRVRLEKLVELRRALQRRYAGMKDFPSFQNLESLKTHTSEPTLEDIFLQKIRQAIEAKMDDAELGIHDLCQAVHLSHTQVFRKLKALTGLNPTLFIRKMRLQKAAELLKTTQKNVSEIAYEVGFTDPNYFSRAFHEEFGAPPSAMRN